MLCLMLLSLQYYVYSLKGHCRSMLNTICFGNPYGEQRQLMKICTSSCALLVLLIGISCIYCDTCLTITHKVLEMQVVPWCPLAFGSRARKLILMLLKSLLSTGSGLLSPQGCCVSSQAVYTRISFYLKDKILNFPSKRYTDLLLFPTKTYSL